MFWGVLKSPFIWLLFQHLQQRLNMLMNSKCVILHLDSSSIIFLSPEEEELQPPEMCWMFFNDYYN